MKKLIQLSALLVGFILVMPSSTFAQVWSGSNPYSATFRYGRVAIGGNYTSTNSSAQLILAHPSKPRLRFERTSSGYHDFEIYMTSGGQLRFSGGANGTGLTDHMIINGSGDVMIGTTNNPTTLNQINTTDYKLFVEGGILTDELLVHTGWADYVFEKDYNLLPIGKVEKYIDDFGHLPNMPSGNTIEENGLEVGKMMVKQQEKIEELTLYIIELNKRLNELEAQAKQ